MSNAVTTSTFDPAAKRMGELGMDIIQIKKEISFAIQHFNKNSFLASTTPESKLASVVNIANIGLTLNPAAKEAYLVPRYNSKLGQNECCLEPSYVGLTKLLTDAGSVKSITTNLVYEGDIFELNLADNKAPVIHKPCLKKESRGQLIGVYSLATLPDDNRQVEWMEISEVYAIRERSESYKSYKSGKAKSSIWVSDEGEMVRKTVVKRIYKYLPRTDRMSAIDNAIEIDNTDYKAEDWQIEKIQQLLDSGVVDRTEKGMIEIELPNISKIRAYDILNRLEGFAPNDNLGKIKAGHTLSSKQINSATAAASE